MIFLGAGYETTSAALAKLAHELTQHPDVQTKLQQEIDLHFPGEVSGLEGLHRFCGFVKTENEFCFW